METTASVSSKDKLYRLISEQLDVNPDDVRLEHDIERDLAADSLDKVEVVMAIEDEFDLRISDEDADNLHTVQQFLDYIEKNTG